MKPATIIESLAAALLLSTCTAETADTTADGRRPLQLSVYVASPTETRAAATYEATGGVPVGQSIGIYGYYHDDTDWATSCSVGTALPNFMFNQRAKNTDPARIYTYQPLKYWPNETADRLSLIAYYPYSDDANSAETGITPLLQVTESALPSYRFAVKTAPDEQVDFLVSTLLADMPGGSTAVVPSQADDRSQLTVTDRVRFPLWHATAKVVVSVDVQDDLRNHLASYAVSSLGITGLYTTGTLTYAADGQTYGWTTEGTPTDNTPFTPGICQLLLPQTLADNVELNIDYSLTFKTDGTVYTYDADGHATATDTYTYHTSGTCQLGSVTTGGAWLPGHVYHYHIRLGAHRIDFTGEIEDWGESLPLGPINLKE